MYVFTLRYGSIHIEDEVTLQLYQKHEDAVEAAELTAQGIFDDDPSLTDDGFSYESTTDTNGDNVVIISQNGSDTEWWRVVRQEVY